MKKEKVIDALKKFETHYKILFFFVVLSLTIAIIRIGVLIHDPNPIILGFEFHHFDYGLLLLFVTTILLLFGKKRHFAYITMAGISFGMILDDLIFIRGNIMSMENQTLVYNSTLPGTLILTVVTMLIILAITYLLKRKKLMLNNTNS